MTRSAKRGPAGLGPILRMAGLLAAAASLWPEMAGAQSFDCRNARSADEFMVCRDPGLARLDQELATLQRYEMDKLPNESRPGFEENAALFQNARRRCGESYRCIEQSYRNRIKEFQDLAAGRGEDAKSSTSTGWPTRRSNRTAETRMAPEAPAAAISAPLPAPAAALSPPPVPAAPAASTATPSATDSISASRRQSESAARSEPVTPLPPRRTEKRDAAVTGTSPAGTSHSPAPERARQSEAPPQSAPSPPAKASNEKASTEKPGAENAGSEPKTKRQKKHEHAAATAAGPSEAPAAATGGSGGSPPTIKWVNPPAGGR